MGGGPPSFPPNITCWAVLTVLHHWWDRVVAYGTLTRSGLPFQYSSADGPPSQRGVGIPLHPDRTTPHRQRIPARTPMRFGLCPVRSPLLRASSLFLGVLRCFSSPGSLPLRVDRPSRLPGCPIRRSRDHQAASASPEHFVAWPRPSSASSAKASTVCPSFRSIHPRGFPTSADHPARLVPRRDNESSRLPVPPLLGEGDGSHLCCTSLRRRTARNDAFFPRSPADGPAGANQSSFSCKGTPVSGAAGARTPNLRRARAALSQLSYDPRPQQNRAGGRAWTRTRDLGLIRAAL